MSPSPPIGFAVGFLPLFTLVFTRVFSSVPSACREPLPDHGVFGATSFTGSIPSSFRSLKGKVKLLLDSRASCPVFWMVSRRGGTCLPLEGCVTVALARCEQVISARETVAAKLAANATYDIAPLVILYTMCIHGC